VKTPSPPRPGFTVFELVVVLAILLMLAALTLPSFEALYGNSKQRAAVDLVRTRIANARTRAMETGAPQRLAISTDGTRIRLAPDGPNFADLPAAEFSTSNAKVNEDSLDKATAGLSVDEGTPAPNGDGNWQTIATFKPDGTCKEDNAIVEIRQDGYPPIRIQIRGVTGTSRILQNQAPNPGAAP
jgi:prepilin-type N-terminal cleavage/methylation domain-containing protein